MDTIAQRLLGLRENLKLTQLKLSKLLGISQTAVNRYEHGETAINANALKKYADFGNLESEECKEVYSDLRDNIKTTKINAQ